MGLVTSRDIWDEVNTLKVKLKSRAERLKDDIALVMNGHTQDQLRHKAMRQVKDSVARLRGDIALSRGSNSDAAKEASEAQRRELHKIRAEICQLKQNLEPLMVCVPRMEVLDQVKPLLQGTRTMLEATVRDDFNDTTAAVRRLNEQVDLLKAADVEQQANRERVRRQLSDASDSHKDMNRLLAEHKSGVEARIQKQDALLAQKPHPLAEDI